MGHRSRNWNQVISKLEDSPPLRFATDLPVDMAEAIEADPGYPALFATAFGNDQITAARIAMAIATYERTLVPDQSPWDLYQAGDETAMTPGQIAGWEDFRDSTVCDNCHQPPEFTDHEFHNIGLRPSFEDIGREAVTGNGGDTGRVKKFLQIDYSAASDRAYADLIDLRSTGIFKNISLTRGQAHRDFFL